MLSLSPTPGTLQEQLQEIIPGGLLERVALDTSPAIHLNLINADYPQGELSQEAIQHLMNNPLYWVFCWASGQVMARFLLDQPDWVQGKRIIDFGSGSGVVAIASALAGAREVIACDIDPLALMATRENAALNGVDLVLADDYSLIEGEIDLILVADVLYDKENFVWLDRFLDRADKVLIADSRVKDFSVPPYRAIATHTSSTMPDLDESDHFRQVRIYLGESD